MTTLRAEDNLNLIDTQLTTLLGNLAVISDSGKVSYQDCWGRPIIYLYPSKNREYLFRLYSIGKNGIDEDGKGDDIDRSFRFEQIKSLFEDSSITSDKFVEIRKNIYWVDVNGQRLIRVSP